MNELSTGQTAPDFTLEDQHGNDVRLSDFRGRKVLLSFHPLAYTSVCTDQMRALEANRERFDAADTVALGLSVDPPPAKAAWAAILSIRSTPILADFWPHGSVAAKLGLFDEDAGVTRRANVLLGPDGKILWSKVYDNAALPDLEEVFAAIEKNS